MVLDFFYTTALAITTSLSAPTIFKPFLTTADSEMDLPAILQIINETAPRYGVESELLQAIVSVESSYDSWTIRYEPNYKYISQADIHAKNLSITFDTEVTLQKCSLGLAQVMGGLARELGHVDHLTKLFDPRVNVDLACRYLAKLLKRYPDEELKVIAAYNAGSARFSNDGKFVNQGYVDKVTSNLKMLRALK